MNGPPCKESAVVRNMAPQKRGLAVATCLQPGAVDSVIVEAEKSLTTAQKGIIALRQKKQGVVPKKIKHITSKFFLRPQG